MWLLLGGFLRFIQMIFTFGTGAPAGLFIPSLYTGAAIGRVTGIFVRRLDSTFHFWGAYAGGFWVTNVSAPGVYAMIGAASVLGGVCRVTISLVVIMFELTSGLQLIVPFMVACLLAKATGELFNPGIYDYCITVRKYPFLHEPDDVTFSTTVNDIMDSSIDCLHPMPGRAGGSMNAAGFLKFLRGAKHGGDPLTVSEADRTLLGYVVVSHVREYLEQKIEDEEISPTAPVAFCDFIEDTEKELPLGIEDLSFLVNVAVTRCVPETPAAQVHYMFRNLGIKIILITKRAALVGMITKKSFIHHMEELHSGEGHHPIAAQKTVADLNAPLLS